MKTVAPKARADLLCALRARKMARSAHAFVRGNTALFYDWLAERPIARGIPAGPPIWICGDCHLGNLGPLADMDGKVDIQMRDFDQSVIGNPAHDLIRLGLSLASVARGSDLPGVTTAHMIDQMAAGYASALRDPEECGEEEPNVVRTVRRRAAGRRWRHLARERIEDVSPEIPLGKRFWPVSDAERGALAGLFETPAVHATILALNGRDGDGEVRLLDSAYWRKGCSSLGTLRYAALVAVTDRKGKDRRLALVDLKEAVSSVAPRARRAGMPRDQARRVVAGARALAPNLGDRMLAVHLLDKPVVLRELMPQDLKLEVAQFSRQEAITAARYLAHVVGRAHAQQLDPNARRAWRAAFTPDGQTWLWRPIVELLAAHERAYLDHCRTLAANL